jgi:hypothetical protein
MYKLICIFLLIDSDDLCSLLSNPRLHIAYHLTTKTNSMEQTTKTKWTPFSTTTFFLGNSGGEFFSHLLKWGNLAQPPGFEPGGDLSSQPGFEPYSQPGFEPYSQWTYHCTMHLYHYSASMRKRWRKWLMTKQKQLGKSCHGTFVPHQAATQNLSFFMKRRDCCSREKNLEELGLVGTQNRTSQSGRNSPTKPAARPLLRFSCRLPWAPVVYPLLCPPAGTETRTGSRAGGGGGAREAAGIGREGCGFRQDLLPSSCGGGNALVLE